MKKLITILSLITLLTSCGKNSSSESKDGKKTNPVVETVELSTEEKTLIRSLLKKGFLDQKELISDLLGLNSFNETTLKKLDHFINVHCGQSSGLCYITHKD